VRALPVRRAQAWLTEKDAFGVHFPWQAQYLVNFENVVTTVVEFHLRHHDDDDSMRQVQYFGCLGLIFPGNRSTL